MALNMKELWACEYSVEQDMFHVGRLDRSLTSTYRAIRDNRTDSYMIIGVFETQDEANEFVGDFRAKFLIEWIKESGGEWECCSCIWRKDTEYKTKRNTCKRKQAGYRCMETL